MDENTVELSAEVKRFLRQSEADVRAGRVHALSEVKSMLNV